MSKRSEIVAELDRVLTQISKPDFNTDFDKVSYWQDTPTEYEKNHLNYRDTTEEYKRENLKYLARLNIEIISDVFETSIIPASELGNLTLVDLIRVLGDFSLKGMTIDILRSHKFVETKGKTCAHIELEIAVNYKF